MTTTTLIPDYCDGVWTVLDGSGGRWWPDDEAAAEVAASDDPAEKVVEICRAQPTRGKWTS